MQLKLACNNSYEFHYLQQVIKVGSETVGGWRLRYAVCLTACLPARKSDHR